jgi:hypothetical protein
VDTWDGVGREHGDEDVDINHDSISVKLKLLPSIKMPSTPIKTI